MVEPYRALQGWCVPDGHGGFRGGFYADPKGQMLCLVPALDQVEDTPPAPRWLPWLRRKADKVGAPSVAFTRGEEPESV